MAQKYIEGDVVMYGNQIMVIKEPRDGSHFDLLWHKRVVYSNIDIEDIKPVPLTPEILEKNGWERLNKIPINCTILYKSHQGLTIGYNINSKIFIYDFGVNQQKKIKFIHQLQHLLFGLGLNSEMEV